MNYYNEIKKELINNEVYKKVKDYSKNRSDLNTYYNVGKLLVEAQGGEKRAKYGDNLIKEYAKKLMMELDKKYSYRNLMSMRKFFIIFNNEKVNALRSQLTWTHYRILLSIKDTNEIIYYINVTISRNLSYRELQQLIKTSEYQRLPEETKKKLANKEEGKINDFIKNPIIIRNRYGYDDISEKILKQLILEDLDNFLLELGEGFTYVKNEYKIKIGNIYNYVDLLLFNYIYNAFVVVELKVTELRKEHIGQIEVYMNYIDKNVKSINQNKTIGIIICKQDNKYVIKYCSDNRIISRKYELV